MRVEGGERRKGTEKEGNFSCNLALSATSALSEYSGDYMLNAEFALSTPSSLFVGFLRAKLWLAADRGVELNLSYALSKMLFNFNFFFKTLLQVSASIYLQSTYNFPSFEFCWSRTKMILKSSLFS